MQDPHVVSLRYRLVPDETTSFENPPAINGETNAFKWRLADEVLDFKMKAHFATREEAREHVEKFLRAWEIEQALRTHGQPVIRFMFDDAQIIDRNPLPPGTPQTICAGGISIGMSFGTAVAKLSHRKYPLPPVRFKATRDVELLWKRYQNYQENRESLETLANFLITTLESRFGDRRTASRTLEVQSRILSKMGELSATRGSELSARKYGALASGPLSDAETRWLHASVLKLIHRLGEYEADPNSPLSKITMDDLPECS